MRATDIKDGEVNTDTLLHIADKQPKLMEKCRLSGGELIIVRSGANTGDCAVVPASLAGAYAAYDLILTFQSFASARFVSTFLDTEIGRLQLNLVRGRAAQPHVNSEEVSALQMPLPRLDVQDKLVAAMDAARAERRAKLAEADALLAGLDSFLLDTLGLTPPPKDDRKVFAVRQGDLQHKQIGANLYAPPLSKFLRALEGSRFPTRKLRDEVALNPAISLEGLQGDISVSFIPMEAVVEGAAGTVHLQTRSLAEVQKGYTPFASGDVLWAKITPCMENGKSCIAPALTNGIGFGSTEFHVLRPLSNRVTPEYVHEFISQVSLRSVARFAFTGSAGHQRVPAEFLADLPFPVPPIAVQETIATEARRRRDEARRLRTEAEAGWQAAKRWFEEQLLGSVK